MRPSLLLVPCVLLALAASAAAETLKVPADFDTINGAVAAANDGDTVVVSKGVYFETVTIANAVKLVGKKAVIDAQFNGNCITVDITNVSISGFTLVNGTRGIKGNQADLVVSKCTIATCFLNGIEIDAFDCTITGNTITACGNNGIAFSGVPGGDTVIEKNVCRLNASNGISVNSDSVEISRNTCEQNGSDGIDVSIEAPVLEGGVVPPMVLEDNDCIENEDRGILVSSSTGIPVTVHGNECSGNGSDGLNFNSPSGDLQGNRCERNLGDGMALATDNSVVSGNTSSGNLGSGLLMTGLPPVADGTIASGNENTVSKNTCNDNGGDGIVLEVGSENSFTGNKCSGNGDDGLDIESDECANNVVEGNNLSKNGHEGLDNGGSATDIVKNTCKGNRSGEGPDIAGAGDLGAGSIDAFEGNKFGTGGEDATAQADNYVFTGP